MGKKGVKCVSVCQLLDMFSWWYRQAKTHCIHLASNKQNCNLQTPMLRVEPQTWPDQKQLVWHFLRSRVRAEALHYTHRTPLHDKRPPSLSLSRAGGTRSRVIKKNVSPQVSPPTQKKEEKIWLSVRCWHATIPNHEQSRWLDLVPPDTFSFAPEKREELKAVVSYRFVDWKITQRRCEKGGNITSTGRESDASGVRFPQVKEENRVEDDSCWVDLLKACLFVFKNSKLRCFCALRVETLQSEPRKLQFWFRRQSETR